MGKTEARLKDWAQKAIDDIRDLRAIGKNGEANTIAEEMRKRMVEEGSYYETVA